MPQKISYITKEEYCDLPIPILLESEFANRRFGLINNNGVSLKFAWQSDLIEPDLLKISEDHYLIGIDQNFAILKFSPLMIELKIALLSNYVSSEVKENKIYVSSELEVFILSGQSYQIEKRYLLPDVFEHLNFSNGEIMIECLDGNSYKLSDLQIS